MFVYILNLNYTKQILNLVSSSPLFLFPSFATFRAIDSHFHGPLPAADCDQYGKEELGSLLGAAPSQVVLMNGLTVNLHILLLDFYRPTETRFKILLEGHAFPSDRVSKKRGKRGKGLRE